jgi:hypothetical protein
MARIMEPDGTFYLYKKRDKTPSGTVLLIRLLGHRDNVANIVFEDHHSAILDTPFA